MIATRLVLALAALASQSLVSVQGRTVTEVEEAAPKSPLEEVCNGETTDTLDVEQVISIAAQIEQDSTIRCSENVREAFKSMSNMISSARKEGCTKETVEAITKSFPSSQDFLETLPNVLSRFVIAYAISMSKHCKEVMIKTILENKQLEESDFVAMKGLFNTDISQLLDSVNDIDSYLLPGDLVAVLPDDQMNMQEIGLNPEALPDELEQLKRMCSRRFRPVYEQVVGPVLELIRANIDYPDEELVAGMDKETQDKLRFWSKVVFLCKTMDMITWPESKSAGENEAKLQQLEYQPVVQDGMNEVEKFPDDELDQHIEFMEFDRMIESAMRKAILAVAKDLTEGYIKDDELEMLVVCVWPGLSEIIDYDYYSSGASSDFDSSSSSSFDSDSDSDAEDSPRTELRTPNRHPGECEWPESAEHPTLGTIVATVVMSAIYPLTM